MGLLVSLDRTKKVARGAVEPKASGAVRVLIISGDAPFFVTHFLALAERAKASGYDVHIATPVDPGSGRRDEEAAQQIRESALAFHRIALKRSNTNPLSELFLIGELAALIRRARPDLIHCIGMKPVLYAGGIARVRGTPAVHTVIGLGQPFMGRGATALLRRSLILKAFAFAFGNSRSRATVEHEEDYSIFLRAKAIAPGQLLRLSGVGVNLQEFYPRPFEPTESNGAPVVMFASRLIAPKGIYDFVAAARRIKSRDVPARFVLQCEPDLRNPTSVSEAEVRGWQEEGVIEWWGHTTDMPEALRRADVFCLPTYYREGVPKVLLEAAATGLPIVTSNVAGCRDVVRHGYNGFLVTPRSLDELEAALVRLLTDSELRRQAGLRSRQTAIERFSDESFINTSLGLYRSVLEPGADGIERRLPFGARRGAPAQSRPQATQPVDLRG